MAKRKLTTEEIRRKLAGAGADGQAETATGLESAEPPPSDPAPAATPFPVDLLPVPIAELVTQGADVLVVPLGYVALPCLTTCAACIGTTRLVYVKDEFVEPPILWTGVVGSTSTRKSAAFRLATRRLAQHQERWEAIYDAQLEEWEENELAQGDSGKTANRKPPPKQKQIYTTDTTIDALMDMMASGGRGALGLFDEMDTWLGGMSRYTNTSERGHWLKFYDGSREAKNRRKDKKQVRVRSASVCIHGGNQPLILRSNLTRENIAAGLFGRFLFSHEPEPVPKFHSREIHPDTMREWDHVIDNLLALDHGLTEDGQPTATVCKFAPEAVAAYGPWWEAWQVRRQETKNPGLEASRGKLVGQCVRLALVMHLADAAWRQSHGQLVRTNVVPEEWVVNAMRLSEWFDSQACVLYGEENVNVGLLSRLQQIGKPVTPSDLVAHKLYDTVGPAKADLQGLVDARKGEWLRIKKKTVFSLFEL